MHLPSRIARPHSRPRLRQALHDARATYRAYSGAPVPDAPPPAPAAPPAATSPPAPAKPPSRSLIKRASQSGREAVRPLSERIPALPTRREDPDVVLDIPNLHVDEVDLHLDELKARVALEAHVLDLLRLDVGIDAELRGVGLKISGVDAEAHLRVRLDNLAVILDRVMDTVDRNPQVLERLADRLGGAVGDLAAGTGSAVHDVGGIARALAPETTTDESAPPPPS